MLFRKKVTAEKSVVCLVNHVNEIFREEDERVSFGSERALGPISLEIHESYLHRHGHLGQSLE